MQQTNSPPTVRLPSRLHTLATMAELLQRLEHQRRSASAAQYRQVASQVNRLLAEAPADDHLHLLLSAYPAASDMYENLRYEMAGLCRAPLDLALRAELATAAVLSKARLPGPASQA